MWTADGFSHHFAALKDLVLKQIQLIQVRSHEIFQVKDEFVLVSWPLRLRGRSLPAVNELLR